MSEVGTGNFKKNVLYGLGSLAIIVSGFLFQFFWNSVSNHFSANDALLIELKSQHADFENRFENHEEKIDDLYKRIGNQGAILKENRVEYNRINLELQKIQINQEHLIKEIDIIKGQKRKP